MARASLYPQYLRPTDYPNINGVPSPAGAAYTWGERFINPRLVPRSHFTARTSTPIYRMPVDVTPFQVYPQNQRAGGRITDDHR